MYDTITLQRSGVNWKVITSRQSENYGVVWLYDCIDDAMRKIKEVSVTLEPIPTILEVK